MKLSINFEKIFKPLLIIAASVVAAGILMLLIFSGKTEPQYTLNNLSFSLFLKSFMTAVLVLLLTSVYFFIRFKKGGIMLGVYTALSAVVNSLVSFALCVITRAPLGGMTFAVIIISVLLTYMVAILFKNNLPDPKNTKKSKKPSQDNYNTTAQKTFESLALVLAVSVAVVVIAFIISLIYGASALALYALPTIVSGLFSVVFTIGVSCNLYSDRLNKTK